MADSHSFVGTWKLVSWEVTQADGATYDPFGKNVIGYLIYTADGYVAAEIMDRNRRQSDTGFPLESAANQTLPDLDRARAYSTYLSYCGTYTVDGDTLNHQVIVGLIPSWTGSDQVRHFTFDDGCLIIEAGNQKLVWERALPHA